jgi:hypothetical protein
VVRCVLALYSSILIITSVCLSVSGCVNLLTQFSVKFCISCVQEQVSRGIFTLDL